MAQIERQDSDSGRTYRIPLPNGEVVIYPSVTSVLSVLNKPWLVPWASKCCAEHLKQHMPLNRPVSEAEFDELLKAAKNQHNWIKEEAGDLGSQAHALIESYLKTGEKPDLDGVDDRVKLGVNKYIDWWCERMLVPIEVEMVVYHEEDRFAGTLDCLAVAPDGSIILADVKTSNHYDKSYGLQVIAYARAYEAMTSCKINNVYVVRVGKDNADIDIHHIPNERHDFLYHCFRAARQLYQWTVAEREIERKESEARKAAKLAEKSEKLAKEVIAKEVKPKLTRRQTLNRQRPV